MDIFPVVPGMTLELGKTGTHYVRAFRFDISAWQDAYPDGIINLIHRLPDANEPYVAGYLRLGEGYIDWVVQSSDVAVPGYGECELVMIVDGVAVDKTDTYPTHIEEQLGTNSVTPPTGVTWVEQVLTVGNATLQAVDGFEDLVAEKEQDITDLASGKEQNITDLAAQKIAAIEAKGTQTLDSIPEDYTELSGEVDDLKSALNGGTYTDDVTSSVEWESGKSVVASNGTYNSENTNYSSADIQLNGASNVSGYTRAGQDSDKGMVFLGTNGQYISGDYNAGATTYDWEYNLIVPEGAAILRLCCATSRIADFTCALQYDNSAGLISKVSTLEEQMEPISSKINDLTDSVDTLENNVEEMDNAVNGSGGGIVDVTSQGTWVNDHGINGNTGSINNETVSYKEYQLGDAVHVAGYTRGGNDLTRGMAFYTASGAYISGDNHYPSDTGYDWNYSFDVPQNAAIFRITCAKSYLDRFTCQFTFSTSEGLISKVSTLETKVQAIEEELDNLDVDVNINDLVSALSYRWVDGYAVSPSFAINNANRGELIVAGTQSVAIADVSGCAGGTIYGHTRLGDDYAIGFYDANGVLISGEKRPSELDYEWDFSLSVPKHAKTVIITCKTTSKNLFSVTGKGTAKAVENVHAKTSLEYECPNDVFGLDSVRSDFHFDSATRLQDIYTWFDILASTFPRNISRVQIGTTTTPEGTYATIDINTYPIYAYVIQGDSYVAGNDFIIASGIHGDESVGDGIQSVVSVAYFIRDMLCSPGKNEYLRFMKWNCKILVIPVMNPWGYQNGKRCNGRGVDVNRNFDINFDPTYESYGYSSGTSAFSENESAAVANYISENFADAKYCTELHTRGGNVLPNDDRWFTTTSSDNSVIQNAVSEVGYYMRRLFGGTVSNGQQDASALPPTFRAYVDHVIGIPANLIECAKSVNMDIATFNSDLVQRQYVQYLGTMIQKLSETYVI